jgi:hypothetical protein
MCFSRRAGHSWREARNNQSTATFAKVFAVYHQRAYVPKSLFIAAQYRERAARLRADAEHVASPKGREDFLALAENWDILADAAERGAERAGDLTTGGEKAAGPRP